MNYGSWTDAELRRALGANPGDATAVAEAAQRFMAQTNPVEEDEVRHVFDVPMECPDCGHEWDEELDTNDYV